MFTTTVVWFLALAIATTLTFQTTATLSLLQTYIVHVEIPPRGTNVSDWHLSFLPKGGDDRIVHTYRHVINGFAAKLTPDELADMEKISGFLHASPDRRCTPHTTSSPSFLGLNPNQDFWPGQTEFGSGVIIGVLDSGITPNHSSFSDEDVPPPPAKWKGRCDLPICNNKIIGARNFIDYGLPPLDHTGHGTHTASTAAGNFVSGANLFGQANGTASGLAPHAHLAIYKVCDIESCDQSNILAGLDAAIEDGVDIISLSIGTIVIHLYEDYAAIGAFAAMKNGIFVSTSASNDGPYSSSVENMSPWTLTVGSSTTYRKIEATACLGNGELFEGQSVGGRNFFPLKLLSLVHFPGQEAEYCESESLDKVDVKGKIILCVIGASNPIGVGRSVKRAGGAGVILMNDEQSGYTTLSFAMPLPSISVSNFVGERIKKYINSTATPLATIQLQGTTFQDVTAPAVASFSSRGPNIASPGILKPDILGPGVNILAAWYRSVDNAKPAAAFYMDSGTSMACPHLSAVAALIKKAHPNWSPAMIKSAMMTTASQLNRDQKPILDGSTNLPADVFATGAGHVNPKLALDPGLVYDITSQDYISYLCSLYSEKEVEVIVREKVNCSGLGIPEAQLNYPSFAVQLGKGGSVTYSRTVTNVGNANSTYEVEIESAPGVDISVEPTVLTFTQLNQNSTYKVEFRRQNKKNETGGYVQGSITWSSVTHNVRIPVSVHLLDY
ncbi:hypothetical protein ABFS82_01G084400 [Erythranthe guttata]|uniref:Uncharacterized protein n=1 Tax=Erythranthe guttata TaxID=4155 RepID=A0A022RGY8_ERYGU|nr:PREDICTED: subtilisin-like protease SBT1.7 [Erythranthe guttata]EYU39048.1 hypothetical protein MIMGU_mgv1a002011mg [Erythranthe guttata]|eukprot:XP_012835515.1 PREDICTED: subtilisin-like protease SBT1.7 [Erythranthe guttata]